MIHASVIIERCGGFKVVADWLDIDRSTVQRWSYDSPVGTGGRIPVRHWSALVEKAREHGKVVTLDELAPEVPASQTKRARKQRVA